MKNRQFFYGNEICKQPDAGYRYLQEPDNRLSRRPVILPKRFKQYPDDDTVKMKAADIHDG